MSAWGVLWLVVLIVACLLYFGVAIFVTIRGAGDLKELFSGDRDEGKDGPDEETPESAAT